MKTLRLKNNKGTWQIKYDEKSRSISVEGPEPEGEKLHHWLTKKKHVVVSKSGDLLAVIPAEQWHYIIQAVEKDLYDDFEMVVDWDSADEETVGKRSE